MSSSSAPPPEDCEYSIPSWKHVPTTAEVLFGLRLPYQPPKSSVGAYIWRKRMWFETTFALTMMQPWEKLILLVLMHTLLILIGTGLYHYFPNHLHFLASRAKYYLLGLDDPDLGVAESFARMMSGWSWNETTAQISRIVDL